MENLNEIQKAKIAVLQNALGICALPESELYERLEKIYWLGFKAGHEMNNPPVKGEIGGPDFDNDPTAGD